MLDINKPWHIKITKDNYDLLNEWWQLTYGYSFLRKEGICGMYDPRNFTLVKGATDGTIKGSWGNFGDEITLEEFKLYVLKQNVIYECWI